MMASRLPGLAPGGPVSGPAAGQGSADLCDNAIGMTSLFARRPPVLSRFPIGQKGHWFPARTARPASPAPAGNDIDGALMSLGQHRRDIDAVSPGPPEACRLPAGSKRPMEAELCFRFKLIVGQTFSDIIPARAIRDHICVVIAALACVVITVPVSRLCALTISARAGNDQLR